MGDRKSSKPAQRSIYASLGLVIAITLPLTIILLVLSAHKTMKILNVNEKSDINYQICLKENDYYPEQCLDRGMQYIANLIDYIDVDFNYDLVADQKVDYEYTYRIDAEVSVFAKNDPTNIIYTNIDELVKEKKANLNGKSLLQIKENLKISYDQYNSLVRKFKNEYGVNADSNIKIRLYIKPVIKYNEFKTEIIKEEGVMELSIPLTESQININASLKNVNNKDQYKDEVNTMLNYVYLGSGIVTALIMLLSVAELILTISKKTRKKSPYQRAVDKILREYDDIISESETIIDPDETEYQYIDCVDFKELKDMALNTGKQIIFSELKELKRPHRSWFYIIDESNKMIYRTVIRADDPKFRL